MSVVHVDTSVLVAPSLSQAHSAAVTRWYGRNRAELASAVGCVTESASALGIRQYTGQRDSRQSQVAWQRFLRLATNDLAFLSLTAPSFHRAAQFSLDVTNCLRAGDAVRPASAEQPGAKKMATLYAVVGRKAQRWKMKLVAFA